MNMQKNILLPFLLLGTLQAQNLKTTISEVISTNPIIQERLNNYKATQKDISSAESGYYPKLDLNLGAGIEKNHKSDANSVVTQDQSFNVYQNSLKYTHNLFTGFSTMYLVKEEEYRTLSAAYSYIEKVNNTSFDALNSYLEVMKNQDLLLTAQENVRIDEEIFSKVQKLYDAGLTTLSEVNKIESSLALAKSNLVVQENTILDVSYNLQRILGRQLDPSKMNKPTIDVAFPNTREDALSFAIKNNPSLLVSDFNIKLAQATKKEKQSVFYPKIDIEVSQSMNKNLSGIAGGDDRFRAMAYLSYNFFNGFADTAALQKSATQVQQEVESKNTLNRQVIESLNLAWNANIKLSEQLEYLRDYKEFSGKTLKLYAKEYDLGRRSLLDLLSAQNDFIKAKEQIVSTEYSLLYAKYRILDAMGLLVPTIMQEDSIVYSNVGLGGKTPENLDLNATQTNQTNQTK
jgi:adhesin transport system outer membrane protein